MINIIIPAAGAATRLRPLTSNCSKAMVRIHGKPAIEYIVESIKKNTKEIAEIVIVDGKFDDIREWASKYNDSRIRLVKQESLDGPRDAIKVGINHLKNKELPLVVWLGDAIILDDNLNLGDDFLLVKDVENHFSWCMWDGKTFFNKPKETVPNASALVGLYSFSDGIGADYSFNKTEGYEISDALEKYTSSSGKTFYKSHVSRWYDIGDISSYHKTCAEFLTFKTRDFNSFEYDSDLNVVTKVPKFNNSFAVNTILNEKKWYNELNSTQRMFVPKILDDEYGLTLSYESGILMSDLLIHEDISNSTIDYLVEKVVLLIRKYFHTKPNLEFIKMFGENARMMWEEKTRDRLNASATKLPKDVVDYYSKVAHRCADKAKPVNAMHGDLHFGNIIYNPYNDSITLIDPRGEYGKHVGTGGDHMYDLCKLSHDLYHGYGSIVSGKSYPEHTKKSFERVIEKHYYNEQKEIIDGGALLIATCIPLHYDSHERQLKLREYAIEHARYRC